MKSSFGYPWVPDQGDGTYRNPILHADYSDPDVIRHGADFWMTASSFTCTPGLPILHSGDLVNWTLVNHAIQQVPHPSYAKVRPGCGVWAPSLRFHAGKFWIFFPLPDEGIYVTTSDHPAEAWCEPWLLQEAKGWIDPCPFWDDDGQAFLAHAYANSRAGKRDRIQVRPMSPDGRKLLGEGREVIYAPQHPYLEGPKVHKRDGWYYVLAPGGGVPTGWQVAFRSRSLYGPYEEKIVLERGSTDINGPHQGALVDSTDGSEWFIHFQDAGPFGRITHLQPVEWRDGWPLIGADYDGNGIGEPVSSWKKPSIPVSGPIRSPVSVGATVPIAIPATTDEFDRREKSGGDGGLSLQWQWHANAEPGWADVSVRPGWLRLQARAVPSRQLGLAPHFLGQKYPARSFSVEALLDPRGLKDGDCAGVAIVGGGEGALIGARRAARELEMVLFLNGVPHPLGMVADGPVRLRAQVMPDAAVQFGFAPAHGVFVAAPDIFRASEGGWLGAKAGLVAVAEQEEGFSPGYADFDYFRFS